MSNDSTDRSRGQASEPSDGSTRRRFLRETTALGLAAAGVGAGTSAASAQWWGSSGVETFELSGFGAAGELPNTDESELVVYLHGAGVSDSAGDHGQSLQDGLADAGYETTVVAGVYETTSVGVGEGTSEAAETLAGLIEDYEDGGGTARVVGYSLGGIVTMQTLVALGDGYVIDPAATFGTGTPDSTVCEGGTYHDGVTANAAEFRVYYSADDSAIQSMNGMEPDCDSTAEVPETLTRVDVTASVPDHLSYLDSDAVMADLGESYE